MTDGYIPVEFTQHARGCLQRAGWHFKREVPIEHYLVALAANGLSASSTARKFLRAFAGLKVQHPHHKNPGAQDHFEINPLQAVWSAPRVLEDYIPRIGKPAIVVGTALSEHAVLVLSDDGEMFAGYDDFLAPLGSSPTHALNTLCDGGDMPEVPSLEPPPRSRNGKQRR